MKIPKKLEALLESNFRFLRFGGMHPETILFGKILKEGHIAPTYIFGPGDVESFMHFGVNTLSDTKYKVTEVDSFKPGEIDVYLENGDHYQLHIKQATMPKNINYTTVSWDDLMAISR